MKKFFILSLALILLPVTLLASTASLAPGSVTVSPGQSVSLTIYANGQGEPSYTVKAAVSFSPELLEVESFSFAPGWLPLSQPGYDSVDNSSGSLVKTAGYGGGFTGQVAFGTITFRAKASGTASVSISGATQILNANNQNSFTGGNSASVSISAASLPSVPARTNPPPSSRNPSNPVRNLQHQAPAHDTSSGEALAATTSANLASATSAAEALPAAVYARGFTDKNVSITWALLGAVISGIIGFLLGRLSIKKYE